MSGIPLPTPKSKLRAPAITAAVLNSTMATASSSSSLVSGAMLKRPADVNKENVQAKRAKTEPESSAGNTLRRAKSYGNLAPPPAPKAPTTSSRKQVVPAATNRTTANRSTACANITKRLESTANATRGAGRGKPNNLETQMLEIEKRVKELENQNAEKQTKLQVSEVEISNRSQELQQLREKLRCEEESRAMEKTMFEHKLREMEFEKLRLSTEVSQLKVLTDELSSQLEAAQKTIADCNALNAGLNAQLEEMNAKHRQDETVIRFLRNEVQELKGNIRVFCRIRPLLPSDKNISGQIPHISITDKRSLELSKVPGADTTMSDTLANARGPNKYDFTFDRVFGPTAGQAEVFQEISQLVQSAVDGYNVCIFAYGQTGSGKTFTMEGGDSSESEGMIPRSMRQVFTCCEELKSKGWAYKIEASFFEIYNEQIRDLIGDSTTSSAPCEVRVNGNEVFVSNLKTVEVNAECQVQELLAQAQNHRAVAATKCNERSSRSHSVFKLDLKGSNSFTSETSKGSLYLVDLAGSERLKESGATGDRLTEMKNINKSLSNLGNVIMALSSKGSHVPYRNSKLTHILQNTLGGSAKTLMFINISPKESSFSETLNSLRFAAKVNQCNIGTAAKRTE